MTQKTFKIAPVSRSTYIGFAALFLLMLIPFAALIYSYKDWSASTGGLWSGLFGLITILALYLLFIFFAIAASNSRIILDDNHLTVKTFLYGRTIPKQNIVSMMSLDLNMQKSYKPFIRTNGLGMPGFSLGWFRLKNKEKALVVLTDRSKAVHISTTLGYSILLSPSNPHDFTTTLTIS